MKSSSLPMVEISYNDVSLWIEGLNKLSEFNELSYNRVLVTYSLVISEERFMVDLRKLNLSL